MGGAKNGVQKITGMGDGGLWEPEARRDEGALGDCRGNADGRGSREVPEVGEGREKGKRWGASGVCRGLVWTICE